MGGGRGRVQEEEGTYGGGGVGVCMYVVGSARHVKGTPKMVGTDSRGNWLCQDFYEP